MSNVLVPTEQFEIKEIPQAAGVLILDNPADKVITLSGGGNTKELLRMDEEGRIYLNGEDAECYDNSKIVSTLRAWGVLMLTPKK